jgi:hypothetical protein
VVAPPSRGLLGGEEGKGGVADRPRPSGLVPFVAGLLHLEIQRGVLPGADRMRTNVGYVRVWIWSWAAGRCRYRHPDG